MKTFGVWLLILLLFTSGASAQIVDLFLTTDKTEYLTGEPIPVAAHILNNAGRTLALGAEENWLTFSVDGNDSIMVAKTGEVPVAKEFALESTKTATKTVDLTPYFSLSQPGRYFVTATALIPNLGDKDALVKSFPPLHIDVVPGLRLWEQEFGVPPGSEPAPGEPEVRKYVLQKVNYKDSMKLYLRLTDATETRIFKVFPIGQMLSFSRLDPKLDKFNNLHLMYQNASHSFLYTMIDPAGELIVRQTRDYTTTRPRLGFDEQSNVVIIGGVRHLSATDIPSSSALLSPDAPQPAAKP
jgi:hypothetical protein